MARGWESKAVEDQLEEAARRQQEAGRPVLSAAMIAQRERLESLRLTQSQLQAQFAKAKSVAQQAWLANALQQLELEITQLVAAILNEH